MINSFLLAFAMYSKIPMPRADWSREKMKYVMVFFPLDGAVIWLSCGDSAFSVKPWRHRIYSGRQALR